MSSYNRGRIKSGRPSRRASNTEESQMSEKTLINMDNNYLDGASNFGSTSMLHASATNDIPSVPGVQMGQGNTDRTTSYGRSRKRKGRGGKVKGLGRGDTKTTYSKGQNLNHATIQQSTLSKY